MRASELWREIRSRRARFALQWRRPCKREELHHGLRAERFEDVIRTVELVLARDARNTLALLFGLIPLLGVAELIAATDAAALPVSSCQRRKA